MKVRFYGLIFIFFLCFSSFLAGWLTAVFILPGNLSQTKPKLLETSAQNRKQLPAQESPSSRETLEQRVKAKTEKTVPFFEEIKNNIMALFDPYKMDSLMKKNTYLSEKNHSIIKNKKPQIPLKIQPLAGDVSNDSEQNKDSKKLNQAKELSQSSLQGLHSLETQPEESQEERGSVLQKLQKEYDKNREQLLQIVESQSFFKMDGKFSFLISVFSERNGALDYVQKMREKYPLWSFLIKPYEDHTRIYLGPFPSKEKALEFKKTMPSSLSQDFLEEISL